MMNNTFGVVFSVINMGIIAFFAVLGIYCLVLFIKLAQKAGRALDIYIGKNNKDDFK